MSVIELDSSHTPIWTITYPAEPTVADYRELLERVRSRCVEGEKYALLLDFTRCNPMKLTAQVRREASEIIKDQMKFFSEYILCEVRICGGPVMRSILTIFDWIARMPWETKNVVSGEVGEHWARAQLQKAGLEAPSVQVWSPPR